MENDTIETIEEGPHIWVSGFKLSGLLALHIGLKVSMGLTRNCCNQVIDNPSCPVQPFFLILFSLEQKA